MSRGNGRKRIFFGDDDCLRFLRQLRDNLTTYDVVLYGYVLMDNDFHAFASTKPATIRDYRRRLRNSSRISLQKAKLNI